MIRSGTIAVAILALAARASAAPAASDVAIDSGIVHGTVGATVASWKGIPFAAPPIGANRWRAPQPIRWTGVRDATRYGHDCMQEPFPSDAAPLGTKPDEDCLVLNVWRPAAAAQRKLPVLVWIYGGGFVNGGSSPAVYDGSKFAAQGVVFVSFNYRLGRFGFFAHPALTAAAEGPLGNYGFMDQIEALKWVRRNIAAFGGDAGNVTVLGESAGGGSTLNILVTPAARGLFQRIAVESGGGRAGFRPPLPLRDAAGAPSAEATGLAFAKGEGIAGSDAATLAALRALPAERLVQGLNMATMGQAAATYAGGPVLDGTIMPATPQVALAAGTTAKVPVLIGSNTADIGFSDATTTEQALAPFGARAAAARTAYAPFGADGRAIGQAVAMDRMMTEPARYVATRMAASGQPAYYYRFGYVSDAMRAKWRQGAPHATDIPYFFDTVDAKYGSQLTATDEAAARLAHGYLVNFAKTGDPNGPGLPRWNKLTPDGGKVLEFRPDGTAAFGPDPWRGRLDLVEATIGGAR